MTDNDRIVERAEGMYLEALSFAVEHAGVIEQRVIQHDAVVIGRVLGKTIEEVKTDIKRLKEFMYHD